MAAEAGDHGYRAVLWPDDGPALIERHWTDLGPGLDALTKQTGAQRLTPDEAAAIPGMASIALMADLLGENDSRPALVSTDPGTLISLISTISNLGYGQRRLLPMPLDLIATMTRRFQAMAAFGSALSAADTLLAHLRERERWAAVIEPDGALGQRCARHLALTGIAVLPEKSAHALLAEKPSTAPEPWLRVERDGDEYELLVRAPGLSKDSMLLSRAGDDLLITVDGAAHPIELPSGLRRCAVIGGSVTENGLHIRFRPEEGKWRDG